MLELWQFVPSLNPTSGGPSVSVRALGAACGANGARVVLLSGTDARSYRRRSGGSDGIYEEHHGVVPMLRFVIGALGSRRRPDAVLIHSVWTVWSSCVGLVAAILRIPIVLTPHGMLMESAIVRRSVKKKVYYRVVDRVWVSRVTMVRMLTEEEKASSIRAFPEISSKCVVVGNGVTVPIKWCEFDKRSVVSERSTVDIVFIGRLHKVKQLDLQIQALSIIARRMPNVRWVVIGPDGGERRRLGKLAEMAHVDGRVSWIGPVFGEDRFEYLQFASVFWLTSCHEAQSMALNEALAMGVPAVITDSVGFSDIERRGCGFVVRSSAEAIAEATMRLLEDGELHKRMASNALSYAEELSWQRMAGKFIDGLVERLSS